MLENNAILRFALVAGLSCITLLQPACASKMHSSPMSAEQEGKHQGRLGNIGVVSAQYVPSVELQMPGKSRMENAGRGAMEYTSMTLDMLSNSANSAAAVAGLILAPVMAVVGGVNGAMMTSPTGTIDNKDAALKAALASMKVQESMRERFLKKTSEKPNFRFSLLEGEGPRNVDEKRNYCSLKSAGFDTIQEVSIRDFGLESDRFLEPELNLYMISKAKLVSTTDNRTILTRTFSCVTGKHKPAYWTNNDAQKFREAIDQCYDDLADQIMTAFFIDDAIDNEVAGRERPANGRPR